MFLTSKFNYVNRFMCFIFGHKFMQHKDYVISSNGVTRKVVYQCVCCGRLEKR